MHKYVLILILLLSSHILYAQGLYSERQINEDFARREARLRNSLNEAISQYNNHIREGKSDYEAQDRYDYITRELKGNIENIQHQINELPAQRNQEIQKYRNLTQKLNNAAKKIELQQREHIRAQERAVLAEREAALEYEREIRRKQREEQKREEERQRRIKYENDYNSEIQRTNSYYAGRKNEVSRMASNETISQMASSMSQTRLEKSINDIEPPTPNNQITSSAGINRLKGKGVQATDKGLVFDEGFFEDMRFESLNENYLQAADHLWRNADLNSVQDYLSQIDYSHEPDAEFPMLYEEWLFEQFHNASGIDIKAILKKENRTEDEKQAILNFEAFSSPLINGKIGELSSKFFSTLKDMDQQKGKKLSDMAVLAKASYNDEESRTYLEYTNYTRLSSSQIEDDNPMKQVANALDICNSTNAETGFHAELFYNEYTGSYTIGIAGTDDKLDVINDASIAFGLETPQYRMAKSIADCINNIQPKTVRDKLDINIVGHSLGGGIASIIGLSTGKPTYTYNAAGVTDSVLKDYGLLERKNDGNYRITAYHTTNDLLTNSQALANSITLSNNIGAKAIGTSIDIGRLNEKQSNTLHPINNFKDKAKGHSITPITDYFIVKGGDSVKQNHEINSMKAKYLSLQYEYHNASFSSHL